MRGKIIWDCSSQMFYLGDVGLESGGWALSFGGKELFLWGFAENNRLGTASLCLSLGLGFSFQK